MGSKKIAELANVSRSTVSKVINGYADVSKETRKKVLSIIKEYNYYPNKYAQILAGKQSNIIGLLIYTGSSENKETYKKIEESFYYSELISKIMSAAQKRGLFVLTSYIYQNSESWEEIFGSEILDGAVVITGGKKSKEIEKLIQLNKKIVLLDYEKEINLKNVITINSNHYKGGFLATEYLIKNGHTNILHITGDIKRKTSILRARGYKDCLSKNNIKNSKIISGYFSNESGYKLMEEYILKNKKMNYSAIFAGNDHIASGVIKALKKYGYKVPEDVSIIGYDNVELCEYTTPTISSLKHLDYNIGEEAIEKLINLFNGEKEKSTQNKLEIIERESVKKL